MAAKRLSVVQIPVTDLARSSEFYGKGLGLETGVRDEEGQFADFHLEDGVSLHLRVISGPLSVGAGIILAFDADNSPLVASRVTAFGGSMLARERVNQSLSKTTLRDPDGHILELLETLES